MRQEQKRQIQEAVLNSMAPAYTGQVSLEDVARAFTGRGSIEEIEECLDDLAKYELIFMRSDERYSVTSLGLERLSQFKFGRIRDKNRLFVLKGRFKKY